MDFSLTRLTPQEEALRAQVRRFLDEELPVDRRRALGQASGGYDPEFTKKLAANGWVGITIPREYGGRGGTAVERFIVTEELLAAQAPVAAHWVADRQTAPTILRYGDESLRQRFLPAIARGECYFAIGMSEPEAGSDLASVRTRARRVDCGWTVTGTKVWTTRAQFAHYFVVLCRTGPADGDHREGLSQLIVDLRDPRVVIHPITAIDGDDEFCEVVLDDVFVPDAMVLGAIGDGWRQVTSELAHERYGPERWLSVWGLLAGYLDLPRESGDVPGVIGELAARYRVIRQLSLSVARSIDAGRTPAVEASVVKDLGTCLEQEVVDRIGTLLDIELDPTCADRFHDIAVRATLTSPIFTVRGGTTEILRSVLAKGLRS